MTASRAEGFTLLEVLVAFVIAAMALALFYEGAIGGLRNARVGGAYQEAVSLARSHLAELSQRGGTAPVNASGDDGKLFHYSVKAAPMAQEQLPRSLLEQANNKPARVATLYALSVTESWTEDGHPRSVHLLGESFGAQAPAQ